MYLFPKITIPTKAQDEAKKLGKAPDSFYCMELLNATGVVYFISLKCMVDGTGFLQKEDTYHFRSTFLSPENEIDGFITKIKEFHESFMKKYK